MLHSSDPVVACRRRFLRPWLLRTLLPWLAVAVLAWMWWSTAVSTSMARFSALHMVEPYAFAVHEQLVRNFALDGAFVQTIHKGYDDAWTWSGHRALTLISSSWLYRLDPSAFGLARTLILGILAGVVPAALIGQRVLRGAPLGLLVGAVAYLGAPAVLGVALQDYQDLCFAAGALVFAWWAMGADRAIWAPIGIFIGMAPREECVPMAVGIALLSIPVDRDGAVRKTRWAWNALVAAAVAGTYVWWAETYFPVSGSGHDMPLENALKAVSGGQARDIFLDGWPYWDRFYSLLLVPFGVFAVFAPEALLPAAALVLLHMTVPVGHGVDRAWSGHAHHMAPAAAFLAVASTVGIGRLLRWLGPAVKRGRLGAHGVHLAVVVAMLVAARSAAVDFSADQNTRLSVVPKNPVWVHPAWQLAAKVPADAVPITSRDLSPTLSGFARSYTYDGSLKTKAKMAGLSAGTHMIVDTRQDVVVQWAMAMPQAKVVATASPFALIAWEAGHDSRWPRIRDTKLARPPLYTGRYRRGEDIPGVAPHASGQRLLGRIPRIRVPAW